MSKEEKGKSPLKNIILFTDDMLLDILYSINSDTTDSRLEE